MSASSPASHFSSKKRASYKYSIMFSMFIECRCTNGNNFESKCRFTCKAGYQLTGSRSRKCNEEREWSGSDANCECKCFNLTDKWLLKASRSAFDSWIADRLINYSLKNNGEVGKKFWKLHFSSIWALNAVWNINALKSLAALLWFC